MENPTGLLGGSRYHGRNTPLRGKCIGPPEGREDGGGRPHLSCTSPYSPRLHPRDVMGQHGHAGMEDETHRKPSKRTLPGVDARKGYALRGAGAAVEAPDVERRRLQGEGTPPASARVATHLRVMCLGSGLTQADVDPGIHQRSMPLLDLRTPRTYYKLDSRRTPAPHTLPRRPGTAAAAYGDAKSGYLTNRVRADGMENILGRQVLDL
ncbi:hypothetical protein COCOBI_02-0760 [Coccomyxa sp. Obi]|nr:hypothetical protein COCOBI_02-0760 [Coccomyxa sp. Obi]